jgi:hypothetical protein
MVYSKTRNNSYAQNNFKSYAKPVYGKAKTYYMNSNTNSYPTKSNYDAQYESKHLLTGGDASGTVWMNSGYDVRAEDPGLSWVL